MDKSQQQPSDKPKGRELNPEEAQKLREGMALKEMLAASEGWKIVEGWLKSRAHHSWVDPRGMDKKEWEWAELNAFHSHDVANTILQDIAESVRVAGELEDIRLGRKQPKSLRF